MVLQHKNYCPQVPGRAARDEHKNLSPPLPLLALLMLSSVRRTSLLVQPACLFVSEPRALIYRRVCQALGHKFLQIASNCGSAALEARSGEGWSVSASWRHGKVGVCSHCAGP